MPDSNVQLQAFQRLLVQGREGGQAKVDALVALAQRTVFVVPWPGGIEGYRTLVNSSGIAALPLFSAMEQLGLAAHRYGWLDAQGVPMSKEIGARAALNYALSQNVSYVVIDIAADHSLEIDRAEFEPLLSPAARRDSSGPFAHRGKISSSLIRAVRPTPPPASREGVAELTAAAAASLSAPKTPTDLGDGFTVTASAKPSAHTTTFGGGTTVTLSKMMTLPEDSLFEALSTFLRGYPEVEWACLVQASRGPGKPVPTIGLRVDTGFRQRVNEIIPSLRKVADERGAALDVLLVDDPALMRTARAEGEMFYPWRRK